MSAREEVRMDECHIQLIAAAAAALKPQSILELGYGSGKVTAALLETIHHYQMATRYVLVDNWLDWLGTMPDEVLGLPGTVKVATSNEEDYVRHAAAFGHKYDLIVSDADHQHSHEWFHLVVGDLLADGGIAFFHDVTSDDHPNLQKNVGWLERLVATRYFWKVFNRNSRPGERCHRGLLMVGKP